jgi:hypothetical protein
MARKHPGAVALGRKGGGRNTPAQIAQRAVNLNRAGQPRKYRLATSLVIERREDGRWVELHPPYDAATMAWLRRHR